jgi:hypothetical protein
VNNRIAWAAALYCACVASLSPSTAAAQGRLGITATQSSGRGLGSQATSVTVMNGQWGFFSAGTLRPFVTGVIPVVGDMPSVDRVIGPLPSYSTLESPIYRRLRLLAEQEASSPNRTPSKANQPAENVPDLDHGPNADPTDEWTRRLSAAAQSSAGQATESVDAIRHARANQPTEKQLAAEDHFRKGVAALEAQNVVMARYHLKIAARDAAPELRPTILAKLRSLDCKRQAAAGRHTDLGMNKVQPALESQSSNSFRPRRRFASDAARDR